MRKKRNQAEERAGIALAAFLATLSTAGREERKPEPPPPSHPATMMQDIWVDGRWVTRELVWDGTSYKVATNA